MDQIRKLFDSASGLSGEITPRTRVLLSGGRTKIAKKVAEEAVEVALEAVADRHKGVVEESADLIYNLVILWVDTGTDPDEIWAEMERRRVALGMAEKLPKARRAAKPPAATKTPKAQKAKTKPLKTTKAGKARKKRAKSTAQAAKAAKALDGSGGAQPIILISDSLSENA